MQDDNTNDNTVVEPAAEESTPPDDSSAPETLQVAAEEVPAEPTPPEESSSEPVQEESPNEAPEEKPPSRREQLRIQQLLRKYGPPPERPAPSPSTQDNLDYSQALDADPDTIQALEEDRRRAAQAQYIKGENEGVKRAEYLNWNTSLKIDAPVVEKKFPVLDKNSPQFHPAVADAVNTWYLNMVGFDPQTKTVSNPNVSYAEFAEGFMELVEETAGQKVAETTQNIARQAATTGLRPDGSSAKRLDLNKAPEDMTMEELYAKIGQRPPKK